MSQGGEEEETICSTIALDNLTLFNLLSGITTDEEKNVSRVEIKLQFIISLQGDLHVSYGFNWWSSGKSVTLRLLPLYLQSPSLHPPSLSNLLVIGD